MRISDWSSDVCSSDLLLLPGHPGEAREAVRPGAARIPGGHAVLARLGGAGATLRRQRPGLLQLAQDRLPVVVLPGRPADLHPVVLGGGGAAVLGARPVLRLALPVRRPAGTDQPPRPAAEGAADQGAVGAP